MEKKKRGREECCNVQSKKGKTEPSRNECSIDYVSHPPSLEHIVIVSVAIRLWTDPDVNKDVKRHSKCYGSQIRGTRESMAYYDLEDRVIKKIEGLYLPDILKIKVSNVIRPIGLQLLKCFDKRDNEYCKLKDLFDKGCSVYWTVEGVIDKRRALVELIENAKEGSNFCQLYRLACKYCLEDYVLQLWGKVPIDRKEKYTSANFRNTYNEYRYHIIYYWTSLITKELPSLLDQIKKFDNCNIYCINSSINQNMVTLSIFVENVFALRYFWSKLTAHEKELNLENWLLQIIQKYQTSNRIYEYQNYHVFTNILCFLLSHSKDQSQIFQSHSEIILSALFFDWPFQRFFLPTFSEMLHYLQEDVYITIIEDIIGEIQEGKTTEEVLRIILRGASEKLKNACLPVIVKSTEVIRNLLFVDDVETVCLLLNHVSADEKKEIIFNEIRSRTLLYIVNRTKFSLLDSLALRNLPSECDVKRFKESLVKEYGGELCHDWILKNNFQSVEKMLQWSFENLDQIKSFKKNGILKNRTYTSLLCVGDFRVVNRFLNWCFDSIEEINDFKQSYILDSTACKELFKEIGRRDNGWDLFEEFLKYSSYSSELVADIKKVCLECVETLLDWFSFKFAEHLLLWCLDNVEDIKEYKNKLFQDERIMKMILQWINCFLPSWNVVNKILKWFSPLPREAVTSLKRDITDDDFTEGDYGYTRKGRKQCFFHLLDNFMEAESTSDSNSNSGDDRGFMEILNDAVENDDDTQASDLSNSDSSDIYSQLCKMYAAIADSDIIYYTDAGYYSSVTENDDSASDDAFDANL